MIEIVPASDLQVGDVFSTDGLVVEIVVRLPKTKRVFVQGTADGWKKSAALAQDFPCPLYREEVVAS